MIITKYELFKENSKNDMWSIIPQSVKDLHVLFKNSDKKLFVVGGAVRDFLNKEDPKDFDLCTDATPDEVLKIVKGYRTNLQGKSFGVVVVYTDDQPMGMEIATFREDEYNDQQLGVTRNPDVKFSTIEKDVERRDIPFNALFFDLDKREIIDLVGGVSDLENKVTKFVGNPELRIKEDPLRILRLLRFNCRYRFTIDEKTAEAIEKNKGQLKIISRERIWGLSGENTGEVKKAWKQAKSFTEYLELFNRFGLWEDVMPGVDINKDIVDSKFLECYLSNLLVKNNPDKILNKLIQEFKIETDMAKKIVFLISLIDISPERILEMYKKKVLSGLSDVIIRDWLRIVGLKSEIFEAFLKFKPSVSSEELMSKGFQGPTLGAEIKRLEIENFKKLIK